MPLRLIPMIIALLPLVTIGISYVISAHAGLVPVCLPLVDGCTSISRAARNGFAIFIFRPGMIITAVLMVGYWYLSHIWFRQHEAKPNINANIMLALGVTGAVFLVLYADFLGTQGEHYRFMRRYGITLFFSCTLLAQFVQLRLFNLLFKRSTNPSFRHSIISVQYMICACILVLGLCSVILKLLQVSTDTSENVLEWNVTLCLSAFFLTNYFTWKDSKFRLTPSILDPKQ